MFRYKLKFDLYFSLIFNRHPFVDCGDFVTWNFANACSGQHSGQVIQDPWFDACPRPISFSCFLFSNLLYFLNYHSWHLMLFGGRKSLPVPCNNVVIKIHVYSYRRVLVVPGPAIQRPAFDPRLSKMFVLHHIRFTLLSLENVTFITVIAIYSFRFSHVLNMKHVSTYTFSRSE